MNRNGPSGGSPAPDGTENGGFDYCETITSGASELLAHLCLRYTHSTEAGWRERIALGLVLVDGSPAEPDTVLIAGQTLTWRRPGWVEPDAPMDFRVLFEDETIIAVDKPSGLPTLPGAGFLDRTLLHAVRVVAPGASPVHRLGRFTSGIVLFSKTAEAARVLSAAFSARAVAKRYRALAEGAPAWNTRIIETPIGRIPHSILGTIHAATGTGKASRSQVDVIERRAGDFLCDVRIATGRPHQIRIHLASCGHPLTGDPLYGPGGRPAENSVALPGDPGYFLHAAAVRFRHPVEDREIEIACEPPAILRPLT